MIATIFTCANYFTQDNTQPISNVALFSKECVTYSCIVCEYESNNDQFKQGKNKLCFLQSNRFECEEETIVYKIVYDNKDI